MFQEKTASGITFTNTADGGVHVQGTSEGYANTRVTLTLPKGRYYVTGVNSVSGEAYVYIQKTLADSTNR